MSKLTRLFGILGAVAVLLGLAASFFVGPTHPYTLVHWLVGGAMLLVFLGFNAAQLRTMFAGRATRQISYTLTFGAAVLASLVAVNVLVVQFPKSVDLTKDNLYSLSDQTLTLLRELKTPTRIFVFVPGANAGPIEDLLKQYDYASDNLSYEVIDPQIELERVKKYEITGDQPMMVIEAGERHLKVQEMSENNITNTLVQLEGGRKKKLYYVTEHQELQAEDTETAEGAGAFFAQLRNENYEVLPLNILRMVQVPDDADAVMLVGLKTGLMPEEAAQITRYLKFGGRLFVASDPGMSNTLLQVLAPMGIDTHDSIIVDQQIRMFAGPQLGVQPLVTDYGSHPITAKMEGLRTTYQMACHITSRPVEGVTVTELARTSESAWAESNLAMLLKEGKVSLDDADAAGPVAVAVASEGYGTPASTAAPLIGTARTVVFCDSDFLTNRWITQLGNMDLAVNSLSWLTGKESSITIRPKERSMSNLFITEEEMTNIFFLTVLIMPELLLIAGLLVWWRRR